MHISLYLLRVVFGNFLNFLRFSWGGELYEFQCLCFGLSPAPYIFTKVMKPILSSLRKDGINSSYYKDDSVFGNKNALVLHQ